MTVILAGRWRLGVARPSARFWSAAPGRTSRDSSPACGVLLSIRAISFRDAIPLIAFRGDGFVYLLIGFRTNRGGRSCSFR